MKKRQIIQSINGIPIPPRRPFKPARSLMLRIVIPGIIPSKKNNYVADRNVQRLKTIFKNWYGKETTEDLLKEILEVKPFIRTSKRYQAWEEAIRPYLLDQFVKWQTSFSKYALQYPITKCSISVYHYWKDNKERDNSNKREGICDLFKKMNIIAGDKFQCLRRDGGEADLYKDEITDHLTVVYLTAYEW